MAPSPSTSSLQRARTSESYMSGGSLRSDRSEEEPQRSTAVRYAWSLARVLDSHADTQLRRSGFLSTAVSLAFVLTILCSTALTFHPKMYHLTLPAIVLPIITAALWVLRRHTNPMGQRRVLVLCRARLEGELFAFRARMGAYRPTPVRTPRPPAASLSSPRLPFNPPRRPPAEVEERERRTRRP